MSQDRLNVLVLNAHVPTFPYDGGGARTIAFLEALGQRHNVTFAALFDPSRDAPEAVRTDLKRYCREVYLVPANPTGREWRRRDVLRDLITYPPPRVTRFVNPVFVDLVSRLSSNGYNSVISNTILAGQALDRQPKSSPRILDVIDVYAPSLRQEYASERSRGLTRIWKYLNWVKTGNYERHLWKGFDAFIAISDKDEEEIRKVCPGRPLRVLPNGVDLPPLAPNLNKDIDLLFVGKLSYSPNIDALRYLDEQIVPILLQHFPRLRIALVGKDPAKEALGLADHRENYSVYPNVQSVNEYYGRARVVVIPMRTGSGIKVKLLEALAFGVPVVTTTFGAYGIPVGNNREVLIADNPSDFAENVRGVLDRPDSTRGMVANGRKLIEQQYDWGRIKEEYLQFVESQSIRTVGG